MGADVFEDLEGVGKTCGCQMMEQECAFEMGMTKVDANACRSLAAYVGERRAWVQAEEEERAGDVKEGS